VRRPIPTLAAVAAVLTAIAVGAGAAPASAATITLPAFHDLPTSGIPDYQLGGDYTPPAGVTIVERDSTSHPASGKYNICYVNGFQTQSEDRSMWLDDHASDVLRNTAGKPISDPGWPDEMILDTSTAAKRSSIAAVLAKSVVKCANRGFDAVEFDNLDSYSRSKGRLTAADNLALAALLVKESHANGLAVGQKNTPDLAAKAKKQDGFDFAVAEECLRYQECSSYTKVYGKRVIDIEYTDDLRGSWHSNCTNASRPAMTILRDRDLVPRGHAGYARASAANVRAAVTTSAGTSAGRTTRVPPPRAVDTSPASSSRAYALATVPGASRRSPARPRTLGRRSPSTRYPAVICAAIWERTCSNGGILPPASMATSCVMVSPRSRTARRRGSPPTRCSPGARAGTPTPGRTRTTGCTRS
jgi:hypothetical protein